MIKIQNSIIPVKGYKALTMWPFIFVRTKYMMKKDWNHEDIHGRQQMEMLPIALSLTALLVLIGCGWWSLLALPLYLYVYVLLYLWELLIGSLNPYKDNPLEREAYMFEGDESYLERRKPFAWVVYFKL